MAGDLTRLSATTLAARLRRREISAEEVMRAHLDRIAALDGRLRAFITVDPQAALADARAADERGRRDADSLPPLHGLPVAIKDVTATASLRTTMGSHLFRDHVPVRDEESVARLRAAGAVVLGKTNTPAFAFGAVCTNALQGPTANPWDVARTSGGSSGGSAVAVATGMAPLAQGTDFGGSVRTPASFCGIVGLRPTPGTIPEPGRALAFSRLATQGVLARSVSDARLLLGAMAGPHPSDPTSDVSPRSRATAPLRIAASADLGGAFPLSPEVRRRFTEACVAAETVLGPVSRDAPDVSGGVQAFRTLRAAESWVKFGALVEAQGAALSSSFVWNVRQGRTISAEDYLKAEIARSRIWRNFTAFFDRYDVLLMPAASVMPFPNAQDEVTDIDGTPMETIIDYLACTFLISLVGFPALSLPVPTARGALPFGLQLVGAPGRERALLRTARLLERAGFRHVWPPEDMP